MFTLHRRDVAPNIRTEGAQMSTLAFLKKKIRFEDVRQEVEPAIEKIRAAINPEAIYLFGSLARDEFTDQSDIDLLIVMNQPSQIKLARQKVAKLRPLSRFPMDIIWMSADDFNRKSQTGGVAQIVKEEGRLMTGCDK